MLFWSHHKAERCSEPPASYKQQLNKHHVTISKVYLYLLETARSLKPKTVSIFYHKNTEHLKFPWCVYRTEFLQLPIYWWHPRKSRGNWKRTI